MRVSIYTTSKENVACLDSWPPNFPSCSAHKAPDPFLPLFTIRSIGQKLASDIENTDADSPTAHMKAVEADLASNLSQYLKSSG